MMKKILKSLIALILVFGVIGKLYVDGHLDHTILYDLIYSVTHINEEKIASPVAEGNMLSFYDEENIGIECEGSTLRISGMTKDPSKSNLLIMIEDNGNEVLQEVVNITTGTPFSASVRIPEGTSDLLEVSVFANSQSHGTFISWVNDYLFIERTGGAWGIKKSPVKEHNVQLFTKAKSADSSLKATKNIQSDNAAIKAAAERATEGCETDYEKAAALHDYVCDLLYYDHDMAARDRVAVESASDVLSSGRGVCSGYANAYAALCRSLGISCVVVTGYAVGMDSEEVTWTEESAAAEMANHAWNEVYADGRWIIVDTTWDCGNSYRNGKNDEETGTSHLYFDANLEFFSANHKILRYKDI